MSAAMHVLALTIGGAMLLLAAVVASVADRYGFGPILIGAGLVAAAYLLGRIMLAILSRGDGPTQADYHAGAA